MKKLGIGLMIFVLMFSLVLAQEAERGRMIDVKEIKAINQIRAGNYAGDEGKPFRIQERENRRLRLHTNNVSADTEIELEEEDVNNHTNLRARLSNGRNALIKIMPDTASARALERLRLKVCSESNNCTIQLKEVGERNKTRPAYEIQAERHSRILGLFQAKMKVRAEVDAENGEVIRTRKPWWAFLASEPEEEITTQNNETIGN